MTSSLKGRGTLFVVLLLILAGLFFLHLSTGFHYFTKEHLLSILLFGGTPEEMLRRRDWGFGSSHWPPSSAVQRPRSSSTV